MSTQDWSERVALLWEDFDSMDPGVFLTRMRALVDERPSGDALAHLELAGAFDSTGDETQAADEYERAFALGLPSDHLRPATIQYASTLRNLKRPGEAVALLEAERDRTSDALDDAVTVFLAFALADSGEALRAVGEVTAALGAHLPRYQRSVAAYARQMRQRH
jgi:tetratricopeptide (TPR) repeat protein